MGVVDGVAIGAAAHDLLVRVRAGHVAVGLVALALGAVGVAAEAIVPVLQPDVLGHRSHLRRALRSAGGGAVRAAEVAGILRQVAALLLSVVLVAADVGGGR